MFQYFEKQVALLYTQMIENTYEIIKLNDLKDAIIIPMSKSLNYHFTTKGGMKNEQGNTD